MIKMADMKKITFFLFILLCTATLAFAQQSQIVQPARYTKTIEVSRTADGAYNLEGKSDNERLLFGDFNAPAEFLFVPSFDGISGLRIYRDSVDKGYRLEVKRVTNWSETNDSINAKFVCDREVRTITLAQWEEQKKQMKASEERRRAEWLRLQSVHTASVPVSDMLAERFKTAITDAIRRVKPVENKTPKSGDAIQIVEIIKDGDNAIFRSVVGDQLWTLNYHVPEGEFKALSDLFRAMIADVEAGAFDEAKYLGILDN